MCFQVEVNQETEKTSSPDLSFPLSTVYNDTDTLAHANVGFYLANSHIILVFVFMTVILAFIK